MNEYKSEKFSIDGGTKGELFDLPAEANQSIAIIEMDGIYPVNGFSVNQLCTETVFMLEGEFEVEVSGKTEAVKQNEFIAIPPKSKYRTKGKGKAVIFISPKWDKLQNKIIKE